jgi:hypothetical protein
MTIATSTGIVSDRKSRNIIGHGRSRHSGIIQIAQRIAVTPAARDGTTIRTARRIIAQRAGSNGGLGGCGGDRVGGDDDMICIAIIDHWPLASPPADHPLLHRMPDPLIPHQQPIGLLRNQDCRMGPAVSVVPVFSIWCEGGNRQPFLRAGKVTHQRTPLPL